MPAWATIGLAAGGAGLMVCVGFWAMSSDTGVFVGSLFTCALPFALLVGFIAFLVIAGKGSRQRCGFCGYSRQGLAIEAPCSECGKPGNAANAPLHKSVGNRPLPYWIWLPAALAVPGAIFAGYLFRRADVVSLALSALPISIVVGVIWSWRQGRETP